MREAMRELTDLSLQLNSESNGLSSTIQTINEKLRSLNLGVEVWLDEPLGEMLPGEELSDGKASFLGYCNVDDRWQLAVRNKFAEMDYSRTGEVSTPPRIPLTQASRQFRLRAIRQLPSLVTKLRDETRGLLKALQDARDAVAALTMDRNDTLALVLKNLAVRYVEGNKHRATFTPTTQEEGVILHEILAGLKAEGSMNELAGTYQFTHQGYEKYKAEIEFLKMCEGL